mgnify:FL=1
MPLFSWPKNKALPTGRVNYVYDGQDAWPLRSDADNADSVVAVAAGSVTVQRTVAEAMGFNGITWDRQRNNHEVTVLASSARTVAVDSSDMTNYNGRGIVVVIDVTAQAGTITPTIQGKAGSDYYTILAGSAIAATGEVVLRVYPGLTAAASVTVNDILPRLWRVSMAVANTASVTYSVSGNYVV